MLKYKEGFYSKSLLDEVINNIDLFLSEENFIFCKKINIQILKSFNKNKQKNEYLLFYYNFLKNKMAKFDGLNKESLYNKK